MVLILNSFLLFLFLIGQQSICMVYAMIGGLSNVPAVPSVGNTSIGAINGTPMLHNNVHNQPDFVSPVRYGVSVKNLPGAPKDGLDEHIHNLAQLGVPRAETMKAHEKYKGRNDDKNEMENSHSGGMDERGEDDGNGIGTDLEDIQEADENEPRDFHLLQGTAARRLRFLKIVARDFKRRVTGMSSGYGKATRKRRRRTELRRK